MTQPTPIALAVDFGGTSVKLAAVDPSAHILARTSFDTASAPGVDLWLDAVSAASRALLSSLPAGAAFSAVGVGVPGFVDFAKGFVHDLANVPGWTAVPLADRLRDRFHLPVAVENDVNAMAAGECAHGAGAGFRDAVFVTLGTGVGGGILINGRLHRGAHSMAGEIGHVSVDLHGPASPMGIGGVEQYVGNRHIAEYAAARLRRGVSSTLAQACSGNYDAITPKHIAEAAAAGDALALETFDFVAMCLASMLASVSYVLQPEAYIIGGGVANAGAVLFDPLKKHLAQRLSPHFLSRLQILPAALGSDAGLVGCATLAFQAQA